MTTDQNRSHSAQRAFSSVMQTIYENLVVEFGEAVATLQRLQRDQTMTPPSTTAGEPPIRTDDNIEATDTSLHAPLHFYTKAELTRQVEHALQRRGIPSQTALSDVLHDLERLQDKVNQRLSSQHDGSTR